MTSQEGKSTCPSDFDFMLKSPEIVADALSQRSFRTSLRLEWADVGVSPVMPSADQQADVTLTNPNLE